MLCGTKHQPVDNKHCAFEWRLNTFYSCEGETEWGENELQTKKKACALIL